MVGRSGEEVHTRDKDHEWEMPFIGDLDRHLDSQIESINYR
jgi:hypothetical protein